MPPTRVRVKSRGHPWSMFGRLWAPGGKLRARLGTIGRLWELTGEANVRTMDVHRRHKMTAKISQRASKNQRLNVRITDRQEQLIRRAAEATDRTVSDFILETTSREAERILTDRRWFAASDAQWDEFDRLLNLPLPANNKLVRLSQRPSPFAE